LIPFNGHNLSLNDYFLNLPPQSILSSNLLHLLDIKYDSIEVENELLMETLRIVVNRVRWAHLSNENLRRFCGSCILMHMH
jgi:hypothetical protein